MDWSQKSKPKNTVQRQAMNLWSGRTKWAEPFGWGRVDAIGMLAAFQVAGEKGATLSIAPGNGGVGVTVRIYMGDKGDYGYAADPEQLNEMLDLLIEQFGSKSEDIKAALKGIHIVTLDSLPAD